jgi:hypothetical protein
MLNVPKLSLSDSCTNNSRLPAIATNFSLRASGVDILRDYVSFYGKIAIVAFSLILTQKSQLPDLNHAQSPIAIARISGKISH